MWEFVLALLLGIVVGTFTGLAPGIHINLVSAILLGSLSTIPFLNSFAKIYFVVFIVAMAITHSLLDFIPSIFLGAPDEDTALSVLPGHELEIRDPADGLMRDRPESIFTRAHCFLRGLRRLPTASPRSMPI